MADDLTPSDVPEASGGETPRALPPAPAPVEEPVARPRADAPRVSSMNGRFRIVYVVLAVLLGAAIGSFVVLTDGTGGGGGAVWSSWRPGGDSGDRMQAIAAYVAPHYRLQSDGRQLVGVDVARPPTVQEVPVKYVALVVGTSRDDISVMPAEDTVAYSLCGLGKDCSISQGKATIERGQLLRREALELALYTLKYVDGVKSVVAFLPPKAGTKRRLALFFQKDQLDRALDAPLARTLPGHDELTPASLSSLDTTVVQRYADPNVFQYTFGQSGNGSVYLALQPPKI